MTHTQKIQGQRVKRQRLEEKKDKPGRRKVKQRRKAWKRMLMTRTALMKKRSSLSLNQDHREDEQEAGAGLRKELTF